MSAESLPRIRCVECGYLLAVGDSYVCKDCGTELPYRALREWVNPQTGGTLPREHRDAILKLLKERDRLTITLRETRRSIAELIEELER